MWLEFGYTYISNRKLHLESGCSLDAEIPVTGSRRMSERCLHFVIAFFVFYSMTMIMMDWYSVLCSHINLIH